MALARTPGVGIPCEGGSGQGTGGRDLGGQLGPAARRLGLPAAGSTHVSKSCRTFFPASRASRPEGRVRRKCHRSSLSSSAAELRLRPPGPPGAPDPHRHQGVATGPPSLPRGGRGLNSAHTSASGPGAPPPPQRKRRPSPWMQIRPRAGLRVNCLVTWPGPAARAERAVGDRGRLCLPSPLSRDYHAQAPAHA